MTIVLLKFFFCMSIIFIGGYALSVVADTIAEKKGLSKTWVGVLLLASITSLPELVTSLSAVNSPDLAFGNIFGSNIINTSIIALMDFLHKGGGPLLGMVSIGHLLNAGLGLLLTGIAIVSIFLRREFSNLFNVEHIGIESILILVIYCLGMYILFKYEQEDNSGPQQKKAGSPKTFLTKEYAILILSALFVIGSGVWLAYLGDEIALITGWGKTFVGSLFLAFATSLPEIVVCLSAIKIRSFDMAVGNVLGSSFFNIAIIPVLDIFYTKGPIFSDVSPDHLLTAALFIIMISIVMVAILCRAKKIPILINYEKWIIASCYIIGSYILFTIAR